MGSKRILLALTGFAGIAAASAGAPVGSADIVQLSVSGGTEVPRLNDWNISVRTTDCSNPVWFLDDGVLISDKPVTPKETGYPDCSTTAQNTAVIAWHPKTPGTHHIVVQQRDSAGNVTSSMSQDYNVTVIPCAVTGSAASVLCHLPSGSS
ncbi:hypothetical protein ACQP1O_16260 [Nocardia sp. CA-151230]|uniref:hypothetical protein n=1 Tax=Nocardia sp. CA-151230 TaxID=3239982 RepID=UPI003D9396DE